MKKNLVLLVPTLQLGGQERVAVNTAEILAKEYNITFVVFDGRDAVYFPPCDVIDLTLPATKGRLNKVQNALRRANALRKLKRDKRVDFTLSFGTTANLANVLAGDPERTFLTLHGYGSVRKNLIGAYIYSHCRKIACVSSVIASELSLLYQLENGKAVTLYNPYNLSAMYGQGEKTVTDYNFSPYTIVAHGRLDEVKNYPRLIKAFFLVRKQLSNAQLLIVGEGVQRSRLERLIAKYHLEDSATLLGFRKNPFAYLSKGTLYVLSSYSEGFPNALVEGMAFLPVVAVDCKSGPREILSDGDIYKVCCGYEEEDYGVLVQPAKNQEYFEKLTEDDRLLADAMLYVMQNPEKRSKLQEKARERAGKFSYESYKTEIESLLSI